MNVSFKLGGIHVQLPAQAVNVKVEEVTYTIENANPLEIAQASAQIGKTFVDMYRELGTFEDQRVKPTSSYIEEVEQKESAFLVEPFSYKGFEQGQIVYVREKKAIILSFNQAEDTALLRFDTEEDMHYTSTYYLEDISEKPLVESK